MRAAPRSVARRWRADWRVASWQAAGQRCRQSRRAVPFSDGRDELRPSFPAALLYRARCESIRLTGCGRRRARWSLADQHNTKFSGRQVLPRGGGGRGRKKCRILAWYKLDSVQNSSGSTSSDQRAAEAVSFSSKGRHALRKSRNLVRVAACTRRWARSRPALRVS